MDIQKIKKYPYLGNSKNLIEYFLIVGFENSSKVEISNTLKNLFSSVSKIENPDPENQDVPKLKYHHSQNMPVVLNNISSNYSDFLINEDSIIKYLFPNKTLIFYVKQEKIEPQNQNLIFYLSDSNLFENYNKENNNDKNNENIKEDNHIIYNIYSYLFWELIIVDNYRFFFPKVFVFISQYSYFNYFSILAQNILFRFRKNSFEIPLEVQLYNIVNFTISPINYDIKLDLLTCYDILDIKRMFDPKKTELIKEKEIDGKEKENFFKKNEDNHIVLPQLTGYPYFDINLSYLFSNFNFESFFTTYLFSFLEFKMIFFSPSLNFLNAIMYIIRFLSYPFIDKKDLGQIYSISKDDFMFGTEIHNNLIGVNCEYDEKIIIPNFYKDYFIISLNNTSINILYNREEIKDINNEPANNKSINNIMKLINYIQSTVRFEEKEKYNFIDKRIKVMHNSLYLCFRNIINSNITFNNNNEREENDFFKELKLDESNYRTYNYEYNKYDDYNSTIIKAFYNFNLSIYEFFHDTVRLVNDNIQENKDKYKSIEFKIKIDNYKENKLNEEDKIFLELFKKTTKYKQFIDLFLKENKCNELNRSSLIIAEEFMNIRKGFDNNELKDNKDYLQLIDFFYKTSNKIKIIDFNLFYINYADNQKPDKENYLAKKMYNLIIDSKIIKILHEAKTNKGKYLYRQKECILDNNILKRYAYIINNMDEKELKQNFPSLSYKQEEIKIEEIKTTDFADLLENDFLEVKFYEIKEIVVVIILIIYIISLKRNKLLFNFFPEILNINLDRKIILRKYIYLTLVVLINKIKEKKNAKENYIKELLIFQEILKKICDLSESNKNHISKTIYLNERIIDIINIFNSEQKIYEELLKKEPSFQKENESVVKKYNEFLSNKNENLDLLEDGVDYKVLLQNNACRDKGAIKDDVLIKISEALDYRGTIQTTCKTCQLKIKPNLFFVLVPIDKSGNINFYSICYLYKNALDILKIVMNGNPTLNEKNKVDKELFNIIGNMIFYLNFKEGPLNVISRYLATSLK